MLMTDYRAARQGVAIVEQSWTGVLRLTGPDGVTWLQGMVSNDVGKLLPGQGCYAAHLNPQGKVLAQMVILADENALLLLMERENVAKLAAAFDRLIIMEDVQVQDMSGEYAVIGLIGPGSAAVLQSLTGESVPESLYSYRRVKGHRVVRSDLGYELMVNREDSAGLVQAAVAAGAVVIDHAAWNVLRAEAGLPVYGVDIDESTTLPELGERGISYDKGCYVGQEVVAKIKYIGHVNRRFCGFVCDGDRIPEVPCSIRANGKDVGHITTALMSPGLSRPIALGFIGRAFGSAGSAVELVDKQGAVAARVAALPFV
jgi:folate-binding protein YgfZ